MTTSNALINCSISCSNMHHEITSRWGKRKLFARNTNLSILRKLVSRTGIELYRTLRARGLSVLTATRMSLEMSIYGVKCSSTLCSQGGLCPCLPGLVDGSGRRSDAALAHFIFRDLTGAQTVSVKHSLSPPSKCSTLISPPRQGDCTPSCELLAFSRTFHNQGTNFPCPMAAQDEPVEPPSHPGIGLQPQTCCSPCPPGNCHRGRWQCSQSCLVTLRSHPWHGRGGTLFWEVGRS